MRELVERPVDGEVEFRGVQNQLLLPPFHRFAPPAGDSVLIDTFGLVGHDQVLVDADHFAVTFAPGQAPTGLLKLNICSVGCSNAMPSSSKRDEKRSTPICPLLQDDDLADAVSVPKRVLDRVSQPAQRFLVGRSPGPVDDDGQIVSSGVVVRAGDHLLDEKRFASGMDTLAFPRRRAASASRSAPALRPASAEPLPVCVSVRAASAIRFTTSATV